MKLAQKLALTYLRARLNLTAVFSTRKAAELAFDIFCTPFRRAAKKEAPIFNSAEQLSVQVEGKKVAVFRWNKGVGRRVLILHGFESSSRNFDRYVKPLLKKGYEVLAMDAPAHGESEGNRINLPLYVKTIEMVNAEFGPMESYMAHSFGGIAIVHYLESYNHSGNLRLALIAPATETVTAIDSLFKILQLSPKVRVEFDKIILEKGGVTAEHYSIPRALDHIHATILWVHDEDDDITPMKDVLPIMALQPSNIEFMVTQNLGHRKIYRENKVVKKVVDFL